MIAQLTAWFGALFKAVFGGLWDLLQDALIWAADGLLSAVASIIGAVPVPAFMQTGLQSFFDALGPGTLYVLSHVNVGPALAMIGTAHAFRLVRKAVTLFQW